MPSFPNPFVGNVPDRKMKLAELIRALRMDMAGEFEAIHLYLAHAETTDNPLVAQVLTNIANEERVHVGELQRLVTLLLSDEAQFLAAGAAEVDDEAAKLGSAPGGSAAASEPPTVGSLKS